MLREFPVTAVSEVREDGTALDAADYERAENSGILYARANGNPSVWSEDSRNLEVDYTAGYAIIPESLAFAATLQVAHSFQQAVPGGGRLGLRGAPLDAGGTPQYTAGPWAPTVERRLEPWRDLAVI